EEESCFLCKRTVEDYNIFVTKLKNRNEAETADIMEEMDSLPVLQVGNTYVTLCPICYELTFGFSSDPEEKLTGVKKDPQTETRYIFNKEHQSTD
ncbi:MAG: hypothetical protein IJ810_00985, partial [Candidatus Methanomethylophilus sp.]|nr:hypothetical protein [Methanomethylophilus sp.]